MNVSNIIGRDNEIAELQRLYRSKKSEFIAIFGRRRIGKSFLINEFFRNKISFSAVGTYLKGSDKDNVSYRQIQLEHFYDSLKIAGLDQTEPPPRNWRECFFLLRKVLSRERSRRKVIFLDELPWLAGPQSAEMIAELGYFWNSWADSQRNIVLIVCGSATSWILDNIIHDYGGLHNRITKFFRLRPFTLAECEKYYKKRGFHLSRYEMCISYMALGGIPYYLDKLNPKLTIAENLDHIFFADETIHQEFKDVYAGLYATTDRYVDVVKTVGRRFYGMTQAEISEASSIKSGGTLSRLLTNLKDSGIIHEYPRYGKQRVETVYQLRDFFSLFYLKFIDGRQVSAGGWLSKDRTGAFNSWAGDSFELLCFEHLSQIKNALRLPSIDRRFSWRGTSPEGKGAQIDLVIECNAARTDYLCEMKFCADNFVIEKRTRDDIQNKIEAYTASKMHSKTHSLQIVLVTTLGLYKGMHSGLINQTLTLKDLFS